MDNKYLPTPGNIPGVVFKLSGKDFVLAPLNLRQVEELEDVIQSLGSQNNMASVAKVASKIVHASLSRNYPDVTEDEVKDLLDISNMQDAMQAVLSTSGYTKGE